MSLIDKLKAARLSEVKVGGFTFTIRRPTDLEWYELKGERNVRELMCFVCGWKDVKECDIVNGGDPHPVPFDLDLCIAWLEDKPEVMGALVQAVLDAFTSHHSKALEHSKN